MIKHRIWLVLVMAALAIAVVAAPASAHASLQRATPSDGEVLSDSPEAIVLEFNEPVAPTVGGIKVYNDQGQRVDRGTSETNTSGVVVTTPLRDDLSDGAYIVSWRVVSADGHTVTGAYFFHVGEEASEIDDSTFAAVIGSGGDRPFGIAAGVARWVTYAASLLAIGAFIFLRLVGGKAATERIIRAMLIASAVGAVASFVQIPLFAAQSTGLGLEALTSGAAWSAAFGGTVGVAALMRVAGFGLLALSARVRWWHVGWVAAAVLVMAEMWTGHTRTMEPTWLVWGSDAIHVAGAAVWFGGLGALALVLRHQRKNDDPAGAASTVASFSSLAAWSVVALTVAGLALSWVHVRAFRALTSTTYGWVLLTKVGIVVLVLAAAAYNNRVLVRRVTDDTADEAATAKAWKRLGGTIRWEITGIVMVLAVTAMLVNVQPASEAAGVSASYSTTVEFGEGNLNVVVDPNRAGTNEIHLYLLTPGGLPAITQGGVTIELRLPSEQIGPFVREAEFAGPGHFQHIGPEMALPGTWEITIRQRISEFDEPSVRIPVVVNP